MTREVGFEDRAKGPRDMGTRTLGTAWRDIGTAITAGGAEVATTFLSIQLHNGTGARFRLVSQYEANGSAFGLVAAQAGTGTTPVNDQVYLLETDADQFVALDWRLRGTKPFVKLQGRVGGGTDAYVSSATLVTV